MVYLWSSLWVFLGQLKVTVILFFSSWIIFLLSGQVFYKKIFIHLISMTPLPFTLLFWVRIYTPFLCFLSREYPLVVGFIANHSVIRLIHVFQCFSMQWVTVDPPDPGARLPNSQIIVGYKQAWIWAQVLLHISYMTLDLNCLSLT